MIDVLYVDPEAFRMRPQIGLPCRMTWHELAGYLSRPTIGEAKDSAGAWSPALYADNVRRKEALVHVHALVVDVDDDGDVDRVADLLDGYSAIVHSTFSSAPEAPRCRIVIELVEPIDAEVYERTHAVVRAHLADAGVVADLSAKDASRLSYSPVIRAGASYRYRLIDGAPLDATAVLEAQPPEPEPSRTVPIVTRHIDRYVDGAIRSAVHNVTGAPVGQRHYQLCREAHGLARLGIDDALIESALLPAFVAAAGKHREREGVRTIRDAIAARRRAG